MATQKKVLKTEDNDTSESNGSLRVAVLEMVLSEIADQASKLSAAPEEEHAPAPTGSGAGQDALEIDLQLKGEHGAETDGEREDQKTSEAILLSEDEDIEESNGQREGDIASEALVLSEEEDLPETNRQEVEENALEISVLSEGEDTLTGGPLEEQVADRAQDMDVASSARESRSASDDAAAPKGDPRIKRAALSAVVIMAILLAADTATPGIQEPEPVLSDYQFSLLAADRHVQSGHSTRIALNSYPAIESDLEFEWVADKGQIEGTGQEVSFIAPHETGPAFVTATVTDKEGNKFQESIPVMIYKQYVILKADDLAFDEATVIPVSWGSFLEFIQNQGIKASIGIKGESIERGDDQFRALIRALDAGGLIEFWNNGSEGSSSAENPLAEIDNVFISGSHSVQKANIARTQDLAGTNLGIVFRTFGAPGNLAGEPTASALKKFEEIDVWLFGDPSFGALVLDQTVPIETTGLSPSFSKFMDEYEPEQPYLILEVHPDEWDQEGRTQFQEIIEYLRGENVFFTTPHEYYQIVNSRYVNLLCNGCTDVDMQIPVLGSPEGSTIVGRVPHNTRVIALDTETSSGIRHYQVVAEGVSGWVSEWFVQEYSAP